MTTTKKTSTTPAGSGFSEAERAAMKDRAEELRASGRGGAKKADNLKATLAKIAEMQDEDRVIAERVHAVVARVAPELDASTWYGMPAYRNADGKIVCFFKAKDKFGERYATLGFEGAARLDDGAMWPTSYALTTMTAAEEKRIEELVRRAAG